MGLAGIEEKLCLGKLWGAVIIILMEYCWKKLRFSLRLGVALYCISGWAQDYPVLKLMNNDRFVIAKAAQSKPDTKLYIYNREKLQGYGAIVKCKKTACLASITEKKDGFNFQRSMIIRYEPRKEKPPSSGGFYTGLGGTLGWGMQFGYFNRRSEKLRLDASFEYLTIKLGRVDVSGMGATVGLHYNYYRSGIFTFPLVLQVCGNLVTLDFTELDPDAKFATEASLVFTFNAIQNIRYDFSKKLYVSAGLGIAYNTFSPEYTDTVNNEKYSVPFDGITPAGNIFFSYAF